MRNKTLYAEMDIYCTVIPEHQLSNNAASKKLFL